VADLGTFLTQQPFAGDPPEASLVLGTCASPIRGVHLDMGCYLEAMQLGAVNYLVEPLTVSETRRVLENYPQIRSIAV
jgi:hypothetical protein